MNSNKFAFKLNTGDKIQDMRKNILVYNDYSNIAEILVPLCVEEEISIRKFITGQREEQPDFTEIHLILLDIFINEQYWFEGIKLIKEIRDQTAIPIIVVSDQKTETVKIMALEAGADDYIITETHPLEIFARIKSQLRHYFQMRLFYSNIGQIFRIDGLEVNNIQRVVKVDNNEIHLTDTEYKILELLIKEKGKILSRAEIYQAVWGMPPIGVNNILSVHIRHIREKIEEDPANPHYLKAARGRGYVIG